MGRLDQSTDPFESIVSLKICFISKGVWDKFLKLLSRQSASCLSIKLTYCVGITLTFHSPLVEGHQMKQSVGQHSGTDLRRELQRKCQAPEK